MTQRKEAKERTRQRLLQAIVELLDEEGAAALTTVRITQRAGVAQPTFYVHFTDVEQGVGVAAEEMARRIFEMLSSARSRPDGERFTLRTALRSLLEAMLADRRMARIFLGHRRDVRSPFGQRFGEILMGARTLVVEEARRAGAARPEPVAMLVVALFIGALEGLLDGRVAKIDDVLDDLVHAISGMIRPPAKA
jgi:AcrR family transcriptional regulator